MAVKLTVNTRDSLGKTINENFKSFDSFASPSLEQAQIIDSFGRGIAALTTNDYQDTIVTSTKSINEIIAEGGLG